MPGRLAKPGLAEHLTLVLVLAAAAVGFAQQDWLWRWDNLLYDAQLRLWSRPAAPDIVLVAVDEASLETLGRWPWNRRLHAQLLDRLAAEGAGVVALDILFAEPDRQDPGADAELARAIRANGRVVLPVVVEQARLGAQLVETLPLPQLTAAAAALGHAHFELDRDSIARRTYLREGLGAPHWPALALAMLELGDELLPALPAARRGQDGGGRWVRQHEALVAFAGPPGHFLRVPYIQVLNGEYPADAFRDKYVLVGITATGLGDILPTPVSGHQQPMAGVELNANLLDALRTGHLVRPVPTAWRLAAIGLLSILGMLVYPLLVPRTALLATLALIAVVLAASSLLLYFGRLWLAPAPAILALVASYPVWSWRRLEHTMRFLRQELERLRQEQERLPNLQIPQLGQALSFLGTLLPIGGWRISDATGTTVERHGEAPSAPRSTRPASGRWSNHNAYWWTRIATREGSFDLCLEWTGEARPDAAQRRCLDELLRVFEHAADSPPAHGTMARVEARIREVQAATARLQGTRRILDDSLSRMADGTLALSAVGQVMFANNQASTLLHGQVQQTVVGSSFNVWLARGGIQDPQPWYAAVSAALLERQVSRFEFRTRQDRDLLVQIAPLGGAADVPAGAVINLSDVSALKDSERRRAETLGFLSHDLRSPLVSLMAILDMAEARPQDPANRELFARARGHTRRTLTLAEQFLELARIEATEAVRFDGVDLVAVADNACDEVWSEARRKRMELVRGYALAEAWINGEAGLLERALTNLLVNAIKYSPEGGRIEVGLELVGTELRLSVSDQGPGIPAELHSTLFDRFTRGDSARAERGTGLGLAFVKAVADRHGGTVRVDSREGQGSKFVLGLPLAPEPA